LKLGGNVLAIQDVNMALFSQIEPKSLSQASEDNFSVKAMNEELDQIQNRDTWELVARPIEENVIGTKWVLINKLNEKDQLIKNTDQLFYKGYDQIEGLDFRGTFSLV